MMSRPAERCTTSGSWTAPASTCLGAAMPCRNFTFATFGEAAAAANALLEQVFVDAPGIGDFDTHPELTFGCTDPPACFVAIPAEISGRGVVSGAVA